MKKWIHAKSDAASIDYKIKDFLADWAKKDAKKNKPAVSMKDFKEAMKAEDLKADQDRYDYYLECYNNAKSGKKSVDSSMTLSNKGREWLASEEVDNLVKSCTPREKRLIGKMSNSTDLRLYLDAMTDTLDVLDVEVSDSFDEFLKKALLYL